MIDDMEVGDFIKVNGEVVKITRYEVEFQGRMILVDGKEPNITIDKKSLKHAVLSKMLTILLHICAT